MKIYGFSSSGNCYKIKLLLTLLGKDFEWVEVNSLQGETRTPEFLEKNFNGKIPLLELENGIFLAESGAILFYLSKNTEFLPQDNYIQSQVLQWILFEQTSIVPCIAINRGMIKFRKNKEQFLSKFEENKINGYKYLEVMDKHLENKNYFVDEKYTIADIALFAYTHVAEEGEFDLFKYKNILRWIKNIESHPRHFKLL
ncbi:MAG: glutathione S-transferase family protein [Candidatus Sericytochromatia bacterium]